MARNTPEPIQQYRGSTAQTAAYTGPEGELTVDTEKKAVVVHDGSTAGGHYMARDADVVHLTGDETISGVKTFGEVHNTMTTEPTDSETVNVGYLKSYAQEKLTAGDGIKLEGPLISVDEDWIVQQEHGDILEASCNTFTGTIATEGYSLVFDRGTVTSNAYPCCIVVNKGTGTAIQYDNMFGIYLLKSDSSYDSCDFNGSQTGTSLRQNSTAYITYYTPSESNAAHWMIGVGDSSAAGTQNATQLRISTSGIYYTYGTPTGNWSTSEPPLITGDFLNAYIVAGDGITVAVSNSSGDHHATIAVDEEWLNTKINSYYDMPLYFDTNNGEYEWGEVHAFVPENAQTVTLLAMEADGSGTSDLSILMSLDIGSGSTLTMAETAVDCTEFAKRAVVFNVTGTSDQTKVAVLLRFGF